MIESRADPGPGPVERQPHDAGSPWWTVHVARYRHAASLVRGGRVLDIACGTGYGLTLLGERARVVGVDLDAAAALTAREQAGKPVLLGDGRKLPFSDRSFDAIVSFETIEHLQHRDRFVSELARVLTDSGILILSTPNANHTKPIEGRPRNPFHVHEYSPEELVSELGAHFESVMLSGQVLDERYLIPPLWDEQEELAANGGRSRVLAWRALAKLPRRLGNAGSRWLLRQPLFPSSQDYRFDESAVETAPVLLALCRSRGRDET